MITGRNKPNSFTNLFKKNKFKSNSDIVFNWIRITFIRAIVSTIVIGLTMISQTLDFKYLNIGLEYIKYSINQEVNIENYIQEASKIPNYIALVGNKAIETIQIEDELERSFIMPVNGEISTYFNENLEGTSNKSKGIIFSTNEGDNIYCVDNGVIIDIGSNKAIENYIIIKHKGELLSVYKYVGNSHLKLNDRVEKGQIIGTASNKLLLEVWNRNEPLDPIKYINLNINQL